MAESDLSQNYTVLKATDELIKRAIPELQSIYEQGMGLKADIEQAQKEAQMNSDDGSRRIEELLEEAKISGDQEQINQILAMTGKIRRALRKQKTSGIITGRTVRTEYILKSAVGRSVSSVKCES